MLTPESKIYIVRSLELVVILISRGSSLTASTYPLVILKRYFSSASEQLESNSRMKTSLSV